MREKPGSKPGRQMMGKDNLACNFQPCDWYKAENGALHREERHRLDGWSRQGRGRPAYGIPGVSRT